jgi:branched-chain amino acid transport system substrate-binding protein
MTFWNKLMNRQSKDAFCLVFFFSLLVVSCQPTKPVVKIGLNAEITGEAPAVGASCVNAAKLYVSEVNQSGGIDIAGKKMPIELVIGDNGSKADESVAISQRLIAQNEVVAMVGPNVSSCAVPSSEIAESMGCLMISPWSTNLRTTRNSDGSFKKNVFRACFTELVETPLLAQFALNNLHLSKAAILYDISSESPNSAAHEFQKSFLQAGGKVVATETYTTGDRDFSAQLTKIKAENPDVFFIPAYYNDVPLIAQQARRLGITAQLIGYNSWSTSDLLKLDTGHCLSNAYFSNHFSLESGLPKEKKFAAQYQAAYGQPPDDIAALTYDTMGLVTEAIAKADSLNRKAIINAMAHIEFFSGVTGDFSFIKENHDPLKDIIILAIKDGKFIYVKTVKP